MGEWCLANTIYQRNGVLSPQLSRTQQYNESLKKNHSNPTHIFNDKSFIVLPEVLQVRFVGVITCKKVRKAQLCRISNNSLLHLRIEK